MIQDVNLQKSNRGLWKLSSPYLSPVTLFIILGNLTVTLFLAARMQIWLDEAYSLNTIGKDFKYAIHQALHFEMQAPIYFMILRLWKVLGSSVFFLRLFSVICIALTIVLVGQLSKRLFQNLHPGWLMAIVAFNPFVIWAAVEMRVYALTILLSALLLLYFLDGYLFTPPGTPARWIYGLLSVMALYTYYFLGFLLFANGAALLLLKRWQAFRAYILCMIFVALSFSPLLVKIPAQASVFKDLGSPRISSIEGIRYVVATVEEFSLPAGWEPSVIWRHWLIRAALPVVIFFLLKRWRALFVLNNLFLWIISFIIIIFYLGIRNLTQEDLLNARHMVPLFLPLILGIFTLLAACVRRRTLITWTCITLFFYGTSAYGSFSSMSKRGDWRGLAGYLHSMERPGQPILVFAAFLSLPLMHYYSGPNQIVPLPKDNNLEVWDPRDFILHDEKEISAALARVPGDPARVWLVTGSGPCNYRDINFNCSLLEDFVSKHYVVESDRSFRLIHVRLLNRKTEERAATTSTEASHPK